MKTRSAMMGLASAALLMMGTEMLAQCCPGHAKPAPAAPAAVSVEAPALAQPAAMMAVTYITKDRLQEMIAQHEDLLIVDVLDADSFAKAHIAGAVNIPLGKMNDALGTCFAEMPKDRPIVVYCANQRCKASTKAAEMLMTAGFTQVVDYENGLAEWVEAKLPVASGKACPDGKVKGQPGCCAKGEACPCPEGKCPEACKGKACPVNPDGAAACPKDAKKCSLGEDGAPACAQVRRE